MNAFWLSVLPNLALGLPSMLVCVLGMSLCVVRKQSLGRASAYATVGFGLLLLSSLTNLGSHAWMMWSVQNGASTGTSLAVRVAVLSVVSTLMSLTGLSLLLAAILSRRPAQGG